MASIRWRNGGSNTPNAAPPIGGLVVDPAQFVVAGSRLIFFLRHLLRIYMHGSNFHPCLTKLECQRNCATSSSPTQQHLHVSLSRTPAELKERIAKLSLPRRHQGWLLRPQDAPQPVQARVHVRRAVPGYCLPRVHQVRFFLQALPPRCVQDRWRNRSRPTSIDGLHDIAWVIVKIWQKPYQFEF